MTKKNPILVSLPAKDLDGLDDADLVPRLLGLPFDLNDRPRITGILYRRPDSPSCGNLLAAVKSAGFSEAGAARTCERLANSRHFQEWVAALTAYYAKTCGLDDANLRIDLAELQSKARERGDLPMMAKVLELKGKYLGVFTGDRGPVEDSAESKHMAARTEEEQAHIRRLADERLREIA